MMINITFFYDFKNNLNKIKNILNHKNEHTNIKENKMMEELFNEKIINKEVNNNDILNSEENKNKKLELTINELSKLINKKEQKIEELYKYLQIKDNIIKDLKLKISRYPFELKEKEKMISINFISEDEIIFYSIICKKVDKFNYIENMLYEKYPEHKTKDNIFMINNRNIYKDKTLIENNIYDNDLIIFKNIK